MIFIILVTLIIIPIVVDADSKRSRVLPYKSQQETGEKEQKNDSSQIREKTLLQISRENCQKLNASKDPRVSCEFYKGEGAEGAYVVRIRWKIDANKAALDQFDDNLEINWFKVILNKDGLLSIHLLEESIKESIILPFCRFHKEQGSRAVEAHLYEYRREQTLRWCWPCPTCSTK